MIISSDKLKLLQNEIQAQLILWKNGKYSSFERNDKELYSNLLNVQYMKQLTFELEPFTNEGKEQYQSQIKQLIDEKKHFLKGLAIMQHINVFKTSYLNLANWDGPLKQKMAQTLEKFDVKFDKEPNNQRYLAARHIKLQKRLNKMQIESKKQFAQKLKQRNNFKLQQKVIMICNSVNQAFEYTYQQGIAFLQSQMSKRNQQQSSLKENQASNIDTVDFMKKAEQQINNSMQEQNSSPTLLAQQFKEIQVEAVNQIIGDLKIAVIASKQLSLISPEKFEKQLEMYQVHDSNKQYLESSIRKNQLKEFERYMKMLLMPSNQKQFKSQEISIYEHTLQKLNHAVLYVCKLFMKITSQIQTRKASYMCQTLSKLFGVVSIISNQMIYDEILFLLNKTVTQDDLVQISYINQILSNEEARKNIQSAKNLKKAFFSELTHFLKKDIRTKNKIHSNIQYKDLMGMTILGTIKGILRTKQEEDMVFRSILMIEKSEVNLKINQNLKKILQHLQDHDSLAFLVTERNSDIEMIKKDIDKSSNAFLKIKTYVNKAISEQKQITIYDLDQLVPWQEQGPFTFTTQKINFLMDDFQSKAFNTDNVKQMKSPRDQTPIQKQLETQYDAKLMVQYAYAIINAIISNWITKIITNKNQQGFDPKEAISSIEKKGQQFKLKMGGTLLARTIIQTVQNVLSFANIQDDIVVYYLKRINNICLSQFQSYSILTTNYEILSLFQMNSTNIAVQKTQIQVIFNKVLNARQGLTNLQPNTNQISLPRDFQQSYSNESKIISLLSQKLGRELQPERAKEILNYIDSRHETFNQITFQQMLDKQQLQSFKKLNLVKEILGMPTKNLENRNKNDFQSMINRIEVLLEKQERLNDMSISKQANDRQLQGEMQIQKEFIKRINEIKEKQSIPQDKEVAIHELVEDFQKKLEQRVSKLNQINQSLEAAKKNIKQDKKNAEKTISVLLEQRQFILKEMKKLKLSFEDGNQEIKQSQKSQTLIDMSQKELIQTEKKLTQEILKDYDKLYNINPNDQHYSKVLDEIHKAKVYLQQVRRTMANKGLTNTSTLARDILVSLQNMRVQYSQKIYSYIAQRQQMMQWADRQYRQTQSQVKEIKQALQNAQRDDIGNRTSISIMIGMIDLIPKTYQETMAQLGQFDESKIKQIDQALEIENKNITEQILLKLLSRGSKYDEDTNEVKQII